MIQNLNSRTPDSNSIARTFPQTDSQFLQGASASGRVLYGQASSLPLRVAVFEPEGLEATLAQLGHSLIRENAVRATAVSNDLLVLRQFTEASLELAQRQTDRSRQMASGELLLGTGVDHGNETIPHPPQQFLARNRF